MTSISSFFNTDLADMAWEAKCREEDLAYRALEQDRRAIDDARRKVDEKTQQLKAIANQSALIAGFSIVAVFTDNNIPENLHPVLVIIFPINGALVVACNLTAMLLATWTLVAILRYDCVQRTIPFDEFWNKRCQDDFVIALKAFSYGVPLFICVMAELGWVSYGQTQGIPGIVSASIICLICLLTMLFWFSHTHYKWGEFLMGEALLYHDANLSPRGSSMTKDKSVHEQNHPEQR
jgi:hypothetical protein